MSDGYLCLRHQLQCNTMMISDCVDYKKRERTCYMCKLPYKMSIWLRSHSRDSFALDIDSPATPGFMRQVFNYCLVQDQINVSCRD